MKKTKVILNAPVQLRASPSFGAIYSAVLADFYAKCLRYRGENILLIINDNITGRKTEKLLGTVTDTLPQLLSSQHAFQQSFGVEASLQLRDDSIPEKTIDLIFQERGVKNGPVNLQFCSTCLDHYGTDDSIIQCPVCNNTLSCETLTQYNASISIDFILKQIENVTFFPCTVRLNLISMLGNFPNKYQISFEKNRKITLEYRERRLDPKFATLASIVQAVTESGESNFETIIFQGDVLKKFTFSLYALLPESYHPIIVASHGLILDDAGSKLRAENMKWIDALPNKKTMRAFLLSFKLGSHIKMGQMSFQQRERGLIRMYRKIQSMVNYADCDLGTEPYLQDEFFEKVERMQFAQAFHALSEIINHYWSKSKHTKALKGQEKEWLHFLGKLYFIDLK
jgi:hypothetical protein